MKNLIWIITIYGFFQNTDYALIIGATFGAIAALAFFLFLGWFWFWYFGKCAKVIFFCCYSYWAFLEIRLSM
jgi:hypothetical protein